MKPTLRFSSRTFLLFFSCLLAISPSCVGPGASRQQSAIMAAQQDGLPVLLSRNPGIGSPDEQANVTQVYARLKAAILADPNDHKSVLQMAQLFMLEARATGEHGHYYPATLQLLDGLLAKTLPIDVVFGVKSLKASVLLSLHQFEEARMVAEEAVALNGYNALIYGSLVDANVELGNYEQAVEFADKMNSIRPDLRSYSRVSYLRELHGDLDGAIEAMTMAAESGFPGYEETAWCQLTLGELYEQKGALKEAKAIYEGILQQRPNYPFAMAALANIAAKEGNQGLAESMLRDAIALIPEVGFYEDLAGLCLAQGRKEEANTLLRDIHAMLADDEAAGHVMNLEQARVWLELENNPEKALAYARKEYDQRPGNIEVNHLMGEILLAMGKAEEAEAHLDRARSTKVRHADLLCLHGLALAKTGNQEAGKNLIRQAFELDPYQDHLFVEEAKALAATLGS